MGKQLPLVTKTLRGTAVNADPIRQGKRAPSPDILACYRSNRERLLMELAKDRRDTSTVNNIRAFYHIVKALEENYELTAVPLPAQVAGV